MKMITKVRIGVLLLFTVAYAVSYIAISYM